MEPNTEQPVPAVEERRRLRISGKAAATGLVVAFLLTGVLIPAVVQLPTWIDFEIVLGLWWAIWWVVLTIMLYQRQRVTHDHELPAPRSWLDWFRSPKQSATAGKSKPAPAKQGGGGGYWYVDFGGADAEGCAWVVGAIVAAIALFFLLWFLIEVAIPLVLFLLYLVTRGMLSHVVNDRHHCHGRLGRSLSWALVWATVYTTPLAFVVWCVHYLVSQRV